MKQEFKKLFAIIQAAVRGTATGRARSSTVKLPTPWESWTIISLLRQRDRQVWACEIVADRLVQLEVAAGTIPGMPEWEYCFHGLGCCLTHKVTGEQIETETGEGFDYFFWVENLASLRNPGPDLQRAIELHSSLQSLRLTLADLSEAGVINTDQKAVHRWTVAEEAVAHTEIVNEFCQLLADATNRQRLSEAIGDSRDADVVRRLRAKRASDAIRRYEESESLRAEALYALADLGGQELWVPLRDALRKRPWSGVTCVALELIAKGDDPIWCADVFRLFGEVNPSGEAPEPAIWRLCAAFLLRHSYRAEEVLANLPLAGPTALGEAAILGLEYGTSPPTALFRRALLSGESAPCDRNLAAAALAVLDNSWSRDLLLSVMQESSDPRVTAASRAALRECHGPEGAAAADAWEQDHPVPESVSHLGQVDWVRFYMEKLHDRVLPLRQRFT